MATRSTTAIGCPATTVGPIAATDRPGPATDLWPSGHPAANANPNATGATAIDPIPGSVRPVHSNATTPTATDATGATTVHPASPAANEPGAIPTTVGPDPNWSTRTAIRCPKMATIRPVARADRSGPAATVGSTRSTSPTTPPTAIR